MRVRVEAVETRADENMEVAWSCGVGEGRAVWADGMLPVAGAEYDVEIDVTAEVGSADVVEGSVVGVAVEDDCCVCIAAVVDTLFADDVAVLRSQLVRLVATSA